MPVARAERLLSLAAARPSGVHQRPSTYSLSAGMSTVTTIRAGFR